MRELIIGAVVVILYGVLAGWAGAQEVDVIVIDGEEYVPVVIGDTVILEK